MVPRSLVDTAHPQSCENPGAQSANPGLWREISAETTRIKALFEIAVSGPSLSPQPRKLATYRLVSYSRESPSPSRVDEVDWPEREASMRLLPLQLLIIASVLAGGDAHGQLGLPPEPQHVYWDFPCDKAKPPTCENAPEALKGLPPLEFYGEVMDDDVGRQEHFEPVVSDMLRRTCDSTGIPNREKGYWFEERAVLCVHAGYSMPRAPSDRFGSDDGYLYVFVELKRTLRIPDNRGYFIVTRPWCKVRSGPFRRENSDLVLSFLTDAVYGFLREFVATYREVNPDEGDGADTTPVPDSTRS
jgi:hypothetical protein